MSAPMVLSVSTLGRIEALGKLLDSVTPQLERGDRLIVVAQAREDEVAELVEQYTAATAGRLLCTTSSRGASLGRNAGVKEAAADLADALVMFPNDTTWFPPGSLAAIASAMRDVDAGAVSVVTPIGPRFVLPPAGTPLDAATVWKVIEMGLVMRLSLFRAVDGFDERIGTGAASPWQAGEVTDLLMRTLSFDPGLASSFRWVSDEAAAVGGIEETAGLSRAERRQKLRAYGRGVGHVFRTQDFPWWHRWRFAVAGLLIGVLRPEEYSLRDGGQAFLGRVEGLMGRTVTSSASRSAVTR